MKIVNASPGVINLTLPDIVIHLHCPITLTQPTYFEYKTLFMIFWNDVFRIYSNEGHILNKLFCGECRYKGE